MLRLLITTFIFTLLISCEGQEQESSSYALKSNSKWNQSSLPIRLSLNSDFSDNEIDAITDMAQEWNGNHDTDFFTVNSLHTAKSAVNPDKLNDSLMGVYKLTTWPSEFPPTALAVTQLYGEEKNGKVYIGHADILVNYEHYNFTTDYSFGYDLATVVLHEMGHFLGMKHFDGHRDESVMYPSITRFTDKRIPTSTDGDLIRDLYHSRSGSSIQRETTGKFNIRIRQALHPDSCTKLKHK